MNINKEEILARRHKLSPTKQALLKKRLQGEVESDSLLKVTPRPSSTAPIPLSLAQQRLWFLQQLDTQNYSYNEHGAIQLKGSLDVAALEQSLNEIVRRHESLRTTFEVVEGQPFQVIAQSLTVTLPLVNLRELPKTQQKTESQRLATEHTQRPFDLVQGPLLRWKLLQLEQQEYVLLVTMHHIICDAWSWDLLIREMAALYEAFSNGKSSPLAELLIQYADFALWQEQWLKGEVLKAQLAYWKQQMGSSPPLLELPTDHPRPAIQTFRGASKSFCVTTDLTKALKALSQEEDATLFMTLLAAFKILLYRYTGTEDIVVGSPIANRNRVEIEPLIGFFVNTLALRTDLSGNPTFRELLGRVRQIALGAYAHQDLPFERLVEILQPQRSLSYMPLFQVMFVLNPPKPELELSGLTLSILGSNAGSAKFDLTLFMEETTEGLIGTLEYNTDLFEAATIQRMVGHLQSLLSEIVANCEQRLSDLPLLTESERHQLLVEWNDTQTDYPQEACIHELFEAQVYETPDAVAVVFEEQQLSYGELNARANQLAHHLQKLGVGPEVLVGICVERSLDMVIGLLGILKAGAAYVPLDPTYPEERLTFILEDAQSPVLLTQQRCVEGMPQHKAKVVRLDTDWQDIAQQSQENLFHEVTTDNLAYVIYTSGSTGRPKGVMLQHRSTMAMLDWAKKIFAAEALVGVLASTSICFDLSIFEMFVPLGYGGKVILSDNALYLPTLPAAKSVTLINTVPSVIAELLRTDSIPLSVSTVNIAGEPLQNKLVQQLYEWDNIRQVFNLYGPSEDTTYSTFAWIQKGTSKIPPIGRPINNTQIYLLAQDLQPVPIGVPGELYIGGEGLARGYLNRQDLTAEKFIPNPFSDQLGARLYKTGDKARYLPTGEIEYIGRIDHQVKIRGFRIELGEIEAAISQHSAVREAVVLVREDSADSQRLIAYIVPHLEQTLTITELRRFLESKLPNYMVPAAFVMLEGLPLTPNKKVDRKALPVPDQIRPELEKAFIAPQTTVEKQLALIWAQVLGLEKVGINDNFFELGGDSILSLQIISKANQAGLYLTPKQLFQHQTIAQLAAVAGTTNRIQAEQDVVTGALPLTPIQHWFFEQKQPDPHHWNQAVLLEVKQNIDPVVLEQVVQSLQRHHDVLRLRFMPEESGWQGVIVSPDEVVVPLTHWDLSALSQEEQVASMEVTAAELQASLNLSEGPLFRVALFDLGGDQPSYLLWAIHHLVVDWVSWRILIADLQTAYQQLSQGKTLQLPPKTTSFKQWSRRLQEYAKSLVLNSELDYWLNKERQSPVKPIPIDYPGGENTEATACTVSASLCEEETHVLLQQVPAAYRTQINDVLLTALVQTFAYWTGESSLLIDLEGHGREELFKDVDLSRTVGWFTSIFPVHLNLENASEPGKAIKAIKEQLRAIPNQGINYGVLRYLSKDKEITEQLSSLPKAEVSFNYLGQLDQVSPESSLFRLTMKSAGAIHSLRSKRTHLLEIYGSIFQGRLEMNWNYSEKLYRQATVEVLAQGFIEALRSLIAHCQSPDAGGFTASDFSEFEQSQWGQADLDAITAAIGDI